MTDGWVIGLTVGLVVLAGCAGPLTPNAGEPTDSTHATSAGASPSAVEASPTDTPTPSLDERLPPGISPDGLENASALLAAHTEAVTATGYVIAGSGASTVRRQGVLVRVRSEQRNRVTANASAYTTRRTLSAQFFGRERASWANGTVEYRRTKTNKEVSFARRAPKSAEELAGVPLLRPHLEGGNYTLVGNESTANGTYYTLSAREIGDEAKLLEALPDAAERVTSYESTVVVDDRGRIRKFQATIGYVIAGRDENQRLEFTLERTGNVSVEPPPWVETAKRRTGDG